MDNRHRMLKNLCDSTDFTDCTIIVDSIKFHCHKAIFSAGSEFFKRMFLSDFQESKSSVVNLENVTPPIFNIFRLYIYTYDNELLRAYDVKTLISLVKCAHMWVVEPLLNASVNILRDRSTVMMAPDQTILFELGFEYNIQQLITAGIIQNMLKTKNNSLFMLKNDCFQKCLTLISNEQLRLQFAKEYSDYNRYLGEKPNDLMTEKKK